jgi:hypothetical protein
VINDFFVVHERIPDAVDVDDMLATVNKFRWKKLSDLCFRKHVSRYGQYV